MLLKKWDYSKKDYIHYRVSDDLNIKLITSDLDEVVNCPHCGKALPYGETYTSMEIHNGYGLGYGICSNCYQAEWERKRKNDRKR